MKTNQENQLLTLEDLSKNIKQRDQYLVDYINENNLSLLDLEGLYGIIYQAINIKEGI